MAATLRGEDMGDATVEIDYDERVFETDMAVLFDMGGDEKVWIPKSVIMAEDEAARTAEIQEWWAEQEGLI
jgi:hypothetical protein